MTIDKVRAALEFAKDMDGLTDAEFMMLEEALSELDGMVMIKGWQPIKTAPRDGREVLTLTIYEWFQSTWVNGKQKLIPRTDKTYHVALYKNGEWFVDERGDGYEYQKITVEPNYWQPIAPYVEGAADGQNN